MKLLAIILGALLLGGTAFATTENLTYVNHIVTQYMIESAVERNISEDNFVQNVECNLFDNKSMLLKIYIPDNIDARTLRYANLEMLKSAIRGHAAAIDTDPLIGDMTVQICNSTAIQCTMRSSRSLITMPLDDLIAKGQVDKLVLKMLCTMTPVIGSHLIGGKSAPVEEYGEYFNP